MGIIWILLFLTVDKVSSLRDIHLSKNASSTLDSLLESNRYDKRIRPGFGGPPVEISVNFLIKSMGPVSEDDQSFGLDCYFRQHWYDLRLQHEKLPGIVEFTLSWPTLEKVWKPDTYIVNGKKSHLHRITAPNKFLRIRYDGFLTYSMRLTILARCPMYLRKFPLDAQRCPLIISSYAFGSEDVVYKWEESKPVSIEKGMELAQFDLFNVTMEPMTLQKRGGFDYSVLQINYWLKRHTGYFMLQVYVPCGLIVTCSWVSFWIDPDCAPARVNLGNFPLLVALQVYLPCGIIVLSSWVSFWIDPDDAMARVALGVTTVLSLTAMGFGGRAQLPKVSYWTALDWFVIICFTSVFSVMIEYACVNFIDKATKDLKKAIEKRRKDETELEAKAKNQELEPPTVRQRSASLSDVQPTSLQVKEEPVRRISIGGDPLPTQPKPSTFIREFPRKLSLLIPRIQDKLTKSFGNLTKMEQAYRDADMKIPQVVISDEDENDAVTVAIEENEDDDVWMDENDAEENEPAAYPTLHDKLKTLYALCMEWKFLPQENEVVRQMAATEPAEKFSKIDIDSRRNFPLVFFISLTIYLVAFAYYLTDDFPERDTDLNLYKH